MELLQPTSIEEAVEALRENEWGARIIAGGTTVVLLMHQGLIAPEVLVSLRRIPDLRYIRDDGEQITIGASTTLRDVMTHDYVMAAYPSLAYACSHVGNVRIQNVATLGGNVAEADYASDPPATLVALGASVRIEGPDGEREAMVGDLLAGFYTTHMEPSEIITAVMLPKYDPATTRDVYLKFVSRSSEDRPCVGVAAWAQFAPEEKNVISDLRVVVGAATGRPQRFPEIEQQAIQRTLDDATIEEVADGYAEMIDPIHDIRGSSWYRKQMARVFVRRALQALAANTESGA